VPLLGLTATPFKGLSEARTESLAARFGRKRLESLGDDPYGVLQEMGVLSRVRHELLDGGEVELNPEERAEASKSSRISPAVLERLGADQDRTLRLVDHISGLNRSWPVLVFTASVLSAQVLAALLQAKGISASSVSGNTKMGERRRILREFHTGGIQVLTNCDVLTQGFDAPGVKALYLARPTFSPNAYIQMVGRGLRGPLNGGKAECLIVDVVDTFSNFQGDLAFRQFDYLWDR
jgi:superfamily II DNA or RNA helicase